MVLEVTEVLLFGSITTASVVGILIGVELYKRTVSRSVAIAEPETEKMDKIYYDPDRVTNKDVIRDITHNQDRGFDKVTAKLDKIITLLSVPKPIKVAKPKPVATSLQARKTIKDLKPKIEQQARDNVDQQILEAIDKCGGQAQMRDIKVDIARATKYRRIENLIKLGRVKKTGVFYHIVKPLEVHSNEGNKENNNSDDVVNIPW